MEIQVDICPMGDPEATKLEYEVYVREGYIEPNDRGEVLENSDYPNFIHFVARRGKETIGAFRLVVDHRARHGAFRLVVDHRARHGAFRLASFNTFKLHPWVVEEVQSTDPKRVVEAGTMVIKPEYRGGETYTLLFQKAFEYVLMSRSKLAMATIDEGFFNRLIKRGLPFKAMGERKFYMGSYTVPAIIDIEYLANMIFGSAPAPVETVDETVTAMAS